MGEKEIGMENNLTVEEASKLMGVSRQFIRVGLQKGVLPFGYAVKISDGRFTYFISRQKFSEHTGIKGEV
jgi:excisionase family DNA binding protein